MKQQKSSLAHKLSEVLVGDAEVHIKWGCSSRTWLLPIASLLLATDPQVSPKDVQPKRFGLDDTRLVSLAMMEGLTFSAGTVGVDQGAEWHEQLKSMSFLVSH